MIVEMKPMLTAFDISGINFDVGVFISMWMIPNMFVNVDPCVFIVITLYIIHYCHVYMSSVYFFHWEHTTSPQCNIKTYNFTIVKRNRM